MRPPEQRRSTVSCGRLPRCRRPRSTRAKTASSTGSLPASWRRGDRGGQEPCRHGGNPRVYRELARLL